MCGADRETEGAHTAVTANRVRTEACETGLTQYECSCGA